MTPWRARTYDRIARPQFEWGRIVATRLALRGDETVLDAGCGTGRLAELLLSRLPNGRIVCVDLSPEMLQAARDRLKRVGAERVTLVQCDLTELALSQSIDVVVSSAVFHWIKDQDRLFQNLRDCLKPNGRLIAQCGGGPNLAREISLTLEFAARRRYSLDFEGDKLPWVFHSEQEMFSVLQNAGFREIDVSLENQPAPFSDPDSYRAFLNNVVLWPFLEQISQDDGQQLLSELTQAAATDNPPLTLDYWRLNVSAQAPE